MAAPRQRAPRGFAPDPERLYEVGRNGRPYTLDPLPPEASEDLALRVRRWWAAAVLVNAAVMGVVAAAALLVPRAVIAWFGILPLLSAPLLLVAPALRRRGSRRSRHVHRSRPTGFPPPPLP